LYGEDPLSVHHDGLHGLAEQSGSLYLLEDIHPFTVDYFEKAGGRQLMVSYEGPGISKKQIPSTILFKDQGPWARSSGENNLQAETFQYAPNPTDGLIRIQYFAVGSEEVILQMVNNLSVVVFEQKTAVATGENYITLNLTPLQGGIYHLFCVGKGKKYSGKISLIK
jgi:hypothetical protein